MPLGPGQMNEAAKYGGGQWGGSQEGRTLTPTSIISITFPHSQIWTTGFFHLM